jgi:hypothetical protein
MFSEYATAFAGTPQALEGIGIERVAPAGMNGPPRGPFGLRVSMTRHGATITNWSAEDMAGITVNICVTGVAGEKVAFPPCVAVIEQVPAARSVTVVAGIVQTAVVLEVKLTARPELAAAAIGNGAAPKVRLFSDAKVIVWLISTILMLVRSLAVSFAVLVSPPPATKAVLVTLVAASREAAEFSASYPAGWLCLEES